MPVSPLLSDLRFCVNAASADFIAWVRGASFVVRTALFSPFALLFVARAREGAADDTLGILTSALVPLLAFSWAWGWGQGAHARLRFLRVARASQSLPATPFAVVTSLVMVASSIIFAAFGTIVARRGGAPYADALAVGRVCFASAIAFEGFGLIASRRPTFGSFFLPFIFVSMRMHREWLYALVPTTHAFALTVDPATGFEARLRFAALLGFGLFGLVSFVRARPVSPAATTPIRTSLSPSSARR